MRQKGQLVKKGSLGEGDVEFWDDGSTSERGGPPSQGAGKVKMEECEGLDVVDGSPIR